MSEDKYKIPRWVTVVVIVAMLPVFQFPLMLSLSEGDASSNRTLIFLYPLYVLLAGFCARQCYPERPWLTWIILVLMLFTHAAMWLLIK